MGFDTVSKGAPTGASGSSAHSIDQVNGVAYFSGPNTNGWQVITSTVAKSNVLAQVANNANVLTYAVPASAIYEIDIHEISANVPTGATLPSITATYTDADTGTSATATLAVVAAVSALGVVNNGVLVVHPKVGTNLVIASTGYAAGSATALSYNLYVRVSSLG